MDTNALMVTFSSKSRHHEVWQAFLAGKYELAVTTPILLEYTEVMGRYFKKSTVDLFVELVAEAPNCFPTEVLYRWNLIQEDPDDDKFVDAAVAARVRFVVSNDKHFAVLKTIDFPSVEVITLDEFLEEVRAL